MAGLHSNILANIQQEILAEQEWYNSKKLNFFYILNNKKNSKQPKRKKILKQRDVLKKLKIEIVCTKKYLKINFFEIHKI